MGIAKADHQLEGIKFGFDENCNVHSLEATMSYAVMDGAEILSRHRQNKDVSPDLDQGQSKAANTLAKRLLELATAA